MKFLDDTRISTHPYPELWQVLNTFVNAITAELAENLIGVYLVGSIASGDFDLDSDVDFLVVTNTELTETNIKSLQEIQIKIHGIDCYPAKHLEGSYISITDLNNWHTVGKKKLYYFNNGSTTFEQSIHDNQWRVRWILRERGITLIGQKPETILQAIPFVELSNEIKTTMLQVMKLFEDDINRRRTFWNSKIWSVFCCSDVLPNAAYALYGDSAVKKGWRDMG